MNARFKNYPRANRLLAGTGIYPLRLPCPIPLCGGRTGWGVRVKAVVTRNAFTPIPVAPSLAARALPLRRGGRSFVKIPQSLLMMASQVIE